MRIRDRQRLKRFSLWWSFCLKIHPNGLNI
nr:MAG TPA: hypothetical protein [Caudoviricetes sp.]